MNNKTKINIAVIGCGYWGPNLVRNFSKVDNCFVKYVCDKKESRLRWIKSLYPSVCITKNYKDILKDRHVTAVAIATPTPTHFPLAREFLNTGRNVLVEKPLTNTSQEANLLVDLGQKHKKILMVSHTYLYSPGIVKLKEIIYKRGLGKIIYINSIRVNLGIFQSNINVVSDLAPHDISIINFILDKMPDYVSCIGSAHYKKDVEDVAFINLYYPQNIITHIHLSWIDPVKIRRLTAVGSEKMAVYNDLDFDEPLKIIEKSVKRVPYYKTYREFKMLYKFGDIHSPHIDNQEPLYIECNHFIESILNNKKPLTSGEEGLQVVRVLELLNKSLQEKGRMIKVNE